MHIFYAAEITDATAVLSEEESLHLSRVLRIQPGALVFLIDGSGATYEGVVAESHAKRSVISNLKIVSEGTSRPYRLHIAIAPTKMMDRFEWFLEKSVEVGIDEITPIITSRSERKVLNTARVAKVVLAAMKQSGNSKFPVLNEPVSFSEFVKPGFATDTFIAHCLPGEKKLTLDKAADSKPSVTVLIGPEGDFTEEEIQKSINAGARPVTLGDSRLRTETAALVACILLQTIWQLKAD